MVPHHSRDIQVSEVKADLRVLKQLAPFLWPAEEPVLKTRVLAALVFVILANVTTVSIPYFMKVAVDALSVDDLSLIAVPVAVILGYGAVRISQVAFAQLQDATIARVIERAVRRIQVRVFSHIQELGLQYHLDRQTGGLSRSIERGARAVDMLLTMVALRTGPAFLQFALVCGSLWYLFGPLYAVITFVSTVSYVWYSITITNWRVKHRQAMNASDGEAHTKLIDALINYETVKYFGNELNEITRVDRALHAYEDAAVRSKSSLALLNTGQGAIIAIGTVAAMMASAYDVKNGAITVGGFVAIQTWLMQVFVPLNFLGMLYREIKQSLVDLKLVFELLDRPPDILDSPDARLLQNVKGTIEFDDVHFAYKAERPILKGVSFKVDPGERVAIVGPTGSGKSTIVRLLFRFFEVTGGAVRIDGQDIRDVTQRSLRAAIGVVPQDTVLFNDSIFHNISYGRLEADRREVEEAAAHAQLSAFIKKLPDGFDTKVGERGLKLSGGEKQRVGIARALLKDPAIMVFDEATSSLDMVTERDILGSMRDVSEGRSTIIIAHRLSTVTDADKIVVLDEGRIAEIGRHQELLQKGGLYARLWEAQRREAEKGVLPRSKPDAVPDLVTIQ